MLITFNISVGDLHFLEKTAIFTPHFTYGKQLILDHDRIRRIVERLAHQIMEEVHTENEVVSRPACFRTATNWPCASKRNIEARIATRVRLAEVRLNKQNPAGRLGRHRYPRGRPQRQNRDFGRRRNEFGQNHRLCDCPIVGNRREKNKNRGLRRWNATTRISPSRRIMWAIPLSTNLHEHVTVEFGTEDKAVLG